MYTAKVYTVSIVSPGVALEEEHIARETLNHWNATSGKEKEIIFLPLPSDTTTEPDIYVMPIDNFVEVAKVEAAIATGARVFLFFRKYHDAVNTIPTELQAIQDLMRCTKATCVDYNSPSDFKQVLIQTIEIYLVKQ